MNPKEELRKQIERYVNKEIVLRDTPAYALSPSEMSYGIIGMSPIKELLEKWAEANYDLERIVVLDKDQSLPKIPTPEFCELNSYWKNQHDMHQALFRKVK